MNLLSSPARAARPASCRRFRQALGLVALSSLLLVPAGAAAERWVPHGPPGGDVLSLLADPLKPGHVYAGTLGGGVFASRDGGESWRQAADGLLVSQVDALAKGATPNAPLYAGTDQGVFRLDEGSVTWRPASTGLPAGEIVGRLAVDPGQPSTLYATVSVGRVSGSFKLYKTTDGGARWDRLSGVDYLRNVLAVSTTSPPTLYTASILGVARSTDRGATWEESDIGLPLTGFLMDVAVVPGSPETLLVSVLDTTPGPAVFRSVDGGRSFTPWSQGLPQIPLPVAATPLAVDPADPSVAYLGGMLGVFRTTDGGAHWAAANGAPANRAIRALAVAPTGGTLFAGGNRLVPAGDAGVLRSTDRGGSWASRTAGLFASSVTSVAPDALTDGRILIATEELKVLRSDDDGGHWVPSGTGIAEPQTGPLVRDPFSPWTFYILAGGSRYFGQSRLYRTTDSGTTWAAVGMDFGCCARGLAADPNTPGTLYLQREQNVLKSTNGGATWQPVNAQPVCPFQSLAVHPANPALLLGGCVFDSGLPVSPPMYLVELHRSLDGGETWTRMLQGDGLSVGSSVRLTFDPHDPTRVFAAAASPEAGGGLYRSQSTGETWSKVQGFDGKSVTSVAFDPARPGHVLAGTSREGVLRSFDGGNTWQPWSEGLGSAQIWDLAFDPARRERVWAGTGGGVYSIERESFAPCSPSATQLCLHGGRFRVRVDWEDFDGNTGTGKTVPLTAATGAFWFFGPENLELAVKVIDGRPVNGHFWVFFGGLSTVRHTITVTDTLTGIEKRYENPSGRLASFGDTSALPDSSPARSVAATAGKAGKSASRKAGEPTRFTLHDGRFAVEVRWRLEDVANAGAGTGVPLSRDTAAVWFFGPENLELFLKILDGRAVNGHYWIFFGALSNVGFEIAVTDTQTGARRVYDNPPGHFGSGVDVELFP